jgi:phosphoglucosamine mutase
MALFKLDILSFLCYNLRIYTKRFFRRIFLMGKYFGTDGFRGEANVDLTAMHAYKIGRFLAGYYRQLRGRRCKFVIGKDTRRSSYMLEYALVAGLTSSGGDAYLLHVTTTPSVSYVVRTEDFDAGLMISASHNPFYDNGIKLLNDRGEKMDADTIALLEDYLDTSSPEPKLAARDEIGRTVDYTAGRNRYMGYLISLAMRSYRGMRVGLDCANGSAWMLAKSIFDALGAKTYAINNEPDGTNINMNCGSTHIEELQNLVRELHLDVGFAFDGDADRCLAVDEQAQIVDGDKILYIYGRYMKERGKLINNTVVTTVMSNLGLYKAFDEFGIDYEQTAVGDRFVYENMLQNGHRLGGEQSGHIIFSKYASTGDGILTAIKLMEVILERKVPLSKLAEPVHTYPQLLQNVRVADKETALQNPVLQQMTTQIEQQLAGDGRVLIRPSGTEPVIRVMVEAATDELCKQYVEQLAAVIK